MLRAILTEFELKAVCIFDATTLESSSGGNSQDNLESKTHDAYISGRNMDEPERDIAVRCLYVRGKSVGAIGFEGLRDPGFTAPQLATLTAAAMERARAFRSAADSAAHARAETLRSAILDALAHEIKTPLATILTAASGMRTTGMMQPQQSMLADLIETEGSRLGDLTSRLLRTARLDTEEIKPRLERLSAAEIAEKSVRRFAAPWRDRRISCCIRADRGEVCADPELILLALSQLLDNACRYSQRDAKVRVEVSSDETMAAISVANEGFPIPAAERNRIFDRFYRGIEARKNAPGSGLGLYIARKIALAHGGDIALVEAGDHAVVFRLSLPLAASEVSVGASEE